MTSILSEYTNSFSSLLNYLAIMLSFVFFHIKPQFCGLIWKEDNKKPYSEILSN